MPTEASLLGLMPIQIIVDREVELRQAVFKIIAGQWNFSDVARNLLPADISRRLAGRIPIFEHEVTPSQQDQRNKVTLLIVI